MTDIRSGSIGEGIEDILASRGLQDSVPVVVAITKFDVVAGQVLFESEGGNSQHLGRAWDRAYTQCKQLCRSLFRRELRDVPAVIFLSWSKSMDFADQALENCVKVNHADIVEIWNMNEKTERSVSADSKIHGKHVPHRQRFGWARWPRRPTESLDLSGSGGELAGWVNNVYRGR
ncbi:hypothetical protein BJV74DRAFT_799856 [Russula compacta]|nr:hypothetical protein BJV74DRAFT_799856 [Russula compacta]